LKPDNIGFAADGTLKLFDFGLVTCVKTRESPTEAYNMTGKLTSRPTPPQRLFDCCLVMWRMH
jgi:hypothetical protein